MQELKNKKILPKFVNHYCDAMWCSLGEFFVTEQDLLDKILKILDREELQILVCFSALKNKMAGAGEVNLKVPDFGLGIEALEKFNLKGKEIIDATKFSILPTSAMVGERLMLELDNLSQCSQTFLSDLSFFTAQTKIPLLIKLGQDLEEVGKIVNIHKCSPVELLESYGFLDGECYLFGLNFIDKDDQKLIKQYDKLCIFSPRSDGEEGRGAINIYNYLYNDLKFGFSSGKCYNIDMLNECKLAKINTFNLMYDNTLLDDEILLSTICENEDDTTEKLELDMDDYELPRNIFDKRVYLEDKNYQSLRIKVLEIVEKIKEKI